MLTKNIQKISYLYFFIFWRLIIEVLMDTNEKLKQGYYLKELRKQLKVTQAEAGGNEFNVVKISRFENGTYEITEEDAKILEKNINACIKSKNESVSYIYFYNHDKYITQQVAESYIASLERLMEDNSNNEFGLLLDEFNNEYVHVNIPEVKLKVFKLAASYYWKQKEYFKCYLYYSRCVDNAIACNDNDEILKNKIYVYMTLIYLGNQDEAIKLLNLLLEKNNLSHKYRYHVYNKLGHAYLKNSNYEKALESFRKSSKYVDKNDLYNYTDVFFQKAWCKRYLGDQKEAIKLLEEGLEHIGNNIPTTRLSFVKHIISAYKDLKDKEGMKLYMNKFVSIANSVQVDNNNDEFVIDIYMDLYDDYRFLDDKESAFFYLNRAFLISNQQQNFHYQNEILKKMLDYYKEIDMDSPEKPNVNRLLIYVSELLTKHPNKIDNNNVAFDMLSYFFEVDQKDMISKLLNLMTKHN